MPGQILPRKLPASGLMSLGLLAIHTGVIRIAASSMAPAFPWS